MAKGSVKEVKDAAVKKVEETKAVVKEVAKAAEEKVASTAKEAAAMVEAIKAEEPAEGNAEVKKPGRKPGRKPGSKNKVSNSTKKSADPEIFVQYGGNDGSVNVIVENIKNEFIAQGHRASSIKDLKVYLKPEDGAAYYVINQKFAGKVSLF